MSQRYQNDSKNPRPGKLFIGERPYKPLFAPVRATAADAGKPFRSSASAASSHEPDDQHNNEQSYHLAHLFSRQQTPRHRTIRQSPRALPRSPGARAPPISSASRRRSGPFRPVPGTKRSSSRKTEKYLRTVREKRNFLHDKKRSSAHPSASATKQSSANKKEAGTEWPASVEKTLLGKNRSSANERPDPGQNVTLFLSAKRESAVPGRERQIEIVADNGPAYGFRSRSEFVRAVLQRSSGRHLPFVNYAHTLVPHMPSHFLAFVFISDCTRSKHQRHQYQCL